MSLQPIEQAAEDWMESQDWIDKVGDPVQDAVKSVYKSGGEPAKKVANFLNGTWLGHPLHPVLTDIPLGAWTAAVFLDLLEKLTGRRRYGKSANAAIALGVGGAVLAATAGLTDWQHLSGKPKKIGVVHATLNLVSLGLFAASMLARQQRKRQSGRNLALMGFGVTLVSGYLGGNLVFRQRIGVNQANHTPLPSNFTSVIALEDLVDGTMHKVVVYGVDILLVRYGDQVYAIGEKCAHLGGSLSQGTLRDDQTVVCPLHGSRYNVLTGEVKDGPSAYPEPCFETRVRNGWVEIRQPDRSEVIQRNETQTD